MIRSLTFLVSLACLLALGGCSSTGIPYHYDADEVPQILEQARADLAAEEPDAEELVDVLRSARAASGISGELRLAVQESLEVAAGLLIAGTTRPGALEKLMEVDLPRRLAVEAGVRGARLYYAKRERMRAFRLLREVDSKYPRHHLRGESGPLLAEIGIDLANDPRRYGLVFRYRTLSIQVLEYMVHEYPSDPMGDEALEALAGVYERRRDWDLAIEKHRDLILWYPDSPLAVASEAHVPRLRLAALQSPEHDRREMLLALDELEGWLADHPGHPLVEEVERHRLDALRRLADNDMLVARFYRTVRNSDGAELHARRALEQAERGGDRSQIQEARGLLRSVAGPDAAGEDGA